MDKLLQTLKDRNLEYTGFFYLGVQEGVDGILRVLEINMRPGCPEFSTIIPTLDYDLAIQLYKTATQQIIPNTKFNDLRCVSVRMINKNYDLSRRKNWQYPVLDNVPNGVEMYYPEDWWLLNALIVSTGQTNSAAADRIHDYLDTVDLGDYTYRTDIGYLE
jgi:phosphoribosylamine-glycine ligase